MAVITVRVDDETKRMMEQVGINWSEFIREAIKKKLSEERRKNLARAVLINEKVRKKSGVEPKAEELVRAFRDGRYGGGN